MNYLEVFPLIKKRDTEGLSKLLDSASSSIFDLNKRLDEEMLEGVKNSELHEYINCTPIYIATKLNFKDIISILLENGADSQKVISDSNGLFVSPYDYTILNKNPEITNMFNKYILENKSKSSIRTKKRPEHATSFNYKKHKNVSKSIGIIQEF